MQDIHVETPVKQLLFSTVKENEMPIKIPHLNSATFKNK